MGFTNVGGCVTIDVHTQDWWIRHPQTTDCPVPFKTMLDLLEVMQ